MNEKLWFSIFFWGTENQTFSCLRRRHLNETCIWLVCGTRQLAPCFQGWPPFSGVSWPLIALFNWQGTSFIGGPKFQTPWSESMPFDHRTIAFHGTLCRSRDQQKQAGWGFTCYSCNRASIDPLCFCRNLSDIHICSVKVEFLQTPR